MSISRPGGNGLRFPDRELKLANTMKIQHYLSRFQRYFRQNPLEVLFLFAILVIAAFLRFYRIDDYLVFLGDEGRDALVVKRMIVDHKLTLLGPTASIASFYLGPAYYYLMLPFLWLFNLNPVGPAVMVALFGVATVLLIYLFGREYFSRRVGLLAAWLYSLSPLVITHSRSSWNPNVLPFFSLVVVWFMRRSLETSPLRHLFLAGLVFGVCLQLHYLAVFLGLAMIGYFLLVHPARKNPKAYLASLFGLLAGWSPFLLFELRHRFPNLRTLYYFLTDGKETGLASDRFFPIIQDVFTRLFGHLVAADHKLLTMILLASTLIFFLAVYRAFNRRRASGAAIAAWHSYLLLAVWLVFGVVLFGFYKNNIYGYYFTFMFALPFLITALIIDRLFSLALPLKLIALILLIALTGANLAASPLKRTPNHQLLQTRRIAAFVAEAAGQKPFNLALVSGGNTDKAYRYFLEVWREPVVTLESPQADPAGTTITDQLFVICEGSCTPLGHPLWEIAGFGMAKIEEKWDNVYGVGVYKLVHIANAESN